MNTDANIAFAVGPNRSDVLTMALDIQFGSQLDDDPAKGGIIFEVAYAQEMEKAREKAEAYLFKSDILRPLVVVIFDFVEQRSREGYRNIEVYFEVLRRNAVREGDIAVHEKGVSETTGYFVL